VGYGARVSAEDERGSVLRHARIIIIRIMHANAVYWQFQHRGQRWRDSKTEDIAGASEKRSVRIAADAG